MDFECAKSVLDSYAAALIQACRKTAYDGTILYTPDGVGNYDALWTRDFGYMMDYSSDLMDLSEIRGCIEYIIRGQREDGWMPDRMEAGGDAVYAAGAKRHPVGRANLDNTPFLVFAVFKYLSLIPTEKASSFFASWSDAIDRGLACIPLSQNGLVWNDPADPHSPYGFTDTVCKTGHLFMESILLWRACRMMENLHRRFGSASLAHIYADRSERIENSVSILFDSGTGAFFAADLDCKQYDVWGMLYALSIGFPLDEKIQSAVEKWLSVHRDRYLYKGQVCQLLDGGAWEKLLIEVPKGEYQNGAYWATASGWALQFFRRADPDFAI